MSITAAQLIAAISVSGDEEAKVKLGSVGDAVDRTSGLLKTALVGAAIAGGIALVGAGVASVKAAGDFQAAITSLVTGAGESASNIKLVSDGILSLAPAVGETTRQLTDGMYMIESAGFHGAAGLEILKDAAEGAKVGNAQLADVANGVTTAMVDYAKSHLTAAVATNTLIAAVALGKTHMQDLASAMSTILPTSAAVGVSFRDTAAAMATMTGEGTDAASAATYLRQLLIALEAPAKAGASALKAIGLTTGEVASEMKVSLPGALQLIMDHLKATYTEGSPQYVEALKSIAGGSRQMQGILELTGSHLKVFQQNVLGIADAVNKGGNAITGWARVQGDFNTKMAQAQATLEVIGIKIGTLLLPALSSLLDKINPVIESFSKWVSSGNGLEHILGQIGAAFNAVFGPVEHITDAVHKATAALQPVTDAFNRTKTGLLTIHTALQPVTDAFDRTKTALVAITPPIQTITDAWDRHATALKIVASSVHATSNPFTAFFTFIKANAVPILAGLSAFILAVLVPAVYSLAVGVIAATWPFLAIGIAVAGLVAIFQHFYSTNAGFRAFIDAFVAGLRQAWSVITANFAPAMQRIGSIASQVGGFLAANFMPVWKQLVALWQGQLVPLFHQLVSGIQPMLPLLGLLAALIGGLLVGAIAAVIKGLAGFLSGLMIVLHGIVQMITGVVQVVGGLIGFFTDLFTGHFDKLKGDLGLIWQGIINIFLGAWTTIAGIFQTAWYTISGIVTGFVDGIIGFFTNLWNAIVGHSIIPDLINGIIAWFTKLPGEVMAQVISLVTQVLANMVRMEVMVLNTISMMVTIFWSWLDKMTGGGVSRVTSLVGQIMGILGSLPSRAASAGTALVQGFINGINSMFGAVGNAMNGLMNFVGSFLPHSPAKQGELANLDKYGPNFVKGFAEGIERAAPELQTSLSVLLKPVATSVGGASSSSFGGAGYQFPSMSGSQAASPQIVVQPPPIYLDGRLMAHGLLPHIVDGIRYRVGTVGL